LALSHNPILSGGIEHDMSCSTEGMVASTSSSTDHELSTASSPSTNNPQMNTTESHRRGPMGRIVRDEEGNVIAVELPEEASEADGHEGYGVDRDLDPNEQMRDPELDQVAVQNWAHKAKSSGVAENGVVAALESLSATASSVVRYSSGGELKYLVPLLQKHGDDVERMSHDRRLNPMQHTAGELKRAIRRGGGRERILSKS